MQKIGLEVGLNVGGLISGAAQGAGTIRELTRAMEEAEKKGDHDLYGKLGCRRDMLQANLQQFGHDTKTLERDPRIQEYNALKAQGKDVSKFTADPEFMSKIGKLNDNQEKLIAALTGVTDAIQKGDFDQIQNSVSSANQRLGEFHQSSTEAATPAGAKGAADAVSTLIL
jgi:hypothetical protein